MLRQRAEAESLVVSFIGSAALLREGLEPFHVMYARPCDRCHWWAFGLVAPCGDCFPRGQGGSGFANESRVGTC